MAKTTTLDDKSGLSDFGKNNDAKIRTKPSDITLRFIFDYAKSVNVIKSRLVKPFVIVNN
ncbi:MAG: hypothetical protein CM15mP23_13350 [Cryomorphaceae bacterium]|nr:MAG: hypothetical protein CM15mP23_13350 [Cryomorphaceae bacterium]